MPKLSQALLALAVTVTLAACGGSTDATPSATTATATAIPTATPPVSVICEFFEVNGPYDDLRDAAIAAAQGDSLGSATRAAMRKIELLAERAPGDEREDLQTLYGTLNEAALTGALGEFYVGWRADNDAFLMKYAEQCGVQLAD